jgi:hypothetical protein
MAMGGGVQWMEEGCLLLVVENRVYCKVNVYVQRMPGRKKGIQDVCGGILLVVVVFTGIVFS